MDNLGLYLARAARFHPCEIALSGKMNPGVDESGILLYAAQLIRPW
jgi:hypothetical protein